MTKIKGVDKVVLPEITVLGKEGSGLSSAATSWVAPLWDEMNQHFDEVVPFIDATEIENLHLWGLMSDQENWLAPWGETGRYLAGVQVKPGTIAPEGWSVWVLPPQTYLTLKTDGEKVDRATEIMLEQVLPLEKVTLAGAVQEHYLPNFAEGEVALYFPVQ